MAKSFDELSADELYELARKKEEQEREANFAARQAEVDALRAKRRELKAKLAKELADIEKQIKALTGKAASAGRRRGRGGARSGISARVVEIISQKGPIHTKDIRSTLEAEGIETANLGQTLAYLKKRGAVTSAERSVYQAA